VRDDYKCEGEGGKKLREKKKNIYTNNYIYLRWVIHVGSGWTSFKNSNPHPIDQLDFTMIKLTPSKSSLWSSRPLNDMMFFANRRRTSPLQPYFHEIRDLHPNLFMKVPNILSLINDHSIFRCGADQVGTFERINMEL
jgi:hypothetical protein